MKICKLETNLGVRVCVCAENKWMAIVQLKITTRGCASNPKTMEANYQKFQESEQKALAAKAQATSTTYTLSN